MTTNVRDHEDLPILDEIGMDLSAALARDERAMERRRRSRRLRRIAVATAAIFVVGPGSVVATRWIWAPDPGVNAPGTPFEGSKPIQIAEGRTGYTGWRISAFMSERGLCWQIARFTPEESLPGSVSCVADRTSATRHAPEMTTGELETFYSGLAPSGTGRVTVVDGAGRHLSAQVVTAPRDRVERAMLPRDLRFYVATGPALGDEPRPPGFVAFDADGREIERLDPLAPPSR